MRFFLHRRDDPEMIRGDDDILPRSLWADLSETTIVRCDGDAARQIRCCDMGIIGIEIGSGGILSSLPFGF